MIGMFKKDLIVLKNNFSAVYLVAIIMPLVLTLQVPDFFPFVISMLCAFLLASQVISSMTYDENTKWEKIVRAMPIPVKVEVYSKYLLGLSFSALSALMTALILLLHSLFFSSATTIIFYFALFSFSIGVLHSIVIIPAAYKLGTVKCRILYMLFIMIPVGSTVLLEFLGIELSTSIFAIPIPALVALLFAILLCGLYASILLSVKFRAVK